ncbi:unnamed protein product [Albugo candida]|uniref:Uncharacterized protein n=1 Tax=Albugo candida TaxID=65357 RepID=A0A024GTK5_9STRA|nr:unnamed protein product [Albugo candida]|eukprot:CCI50037.1 unnamed protein product [Albugo candida]
MQSDLKKNVSTAPDTRTLQINSQTPTIPASQDEAPYPSLEPLKSSWMSRAQEISRSMFRHEYDRNYFTTQRYDRRYEPRRNAETQKSLKLTKLPHAVEFQKNKWLRENIAEEQGQKTKLTAAKEKEGVRIVGRNASTEKHLYIASIHAAEKKKQKVEAHGDVPEFKSSSACSQNESQMENENEVEDDDMIVGNIERAVLPVLVNDSNRPVQYLTLKPMYIEGGAEVNVDNANDEDLDDESDEYEGTEWTKS